MITSEIKNFIKDHALTTSPQECCGLIVEEPTHLTQHAIRCKNLAENPLHNFSIDPRDYLTAARKGKIQATYHSHLGKEGFSEIDKMNSSANQLKYILYSIQQDLFSEFDPSTNKILYLNKPFKIGVNDCFTLVKNYYADNLQLKLPEEIVKIYKQSSEKEDLQRAVKLIEKKSITYEDNFTQNSDGELVVSSEKENFIKLFPKTEKDLKKHDILIFGGKPRHKPYHMGIYMGNTTFIHHPRNKFARSETINQFFWKRLIYTYRHK